MAAAAAVVAIATLGSVATAAAEPDLMPVSSSARAAAQVVHEYERSNALPPSPAEDASEAEHAEYAELENAFVRGFPIAAGVEQWGCRLVDADFYTVPQAAGLASDGRVRLGWVPDEPPACNPGYLVRQYGTYTWGPGSNLTLVYPAAQPSNWSSAFEDVDQSDGRIIGIRTMACAFG